MSDVKNIEWSPEEYSQSAFLAQEAGQEMLSRLDLMTIEPELIVDVGCGLGEVATGLAKRFPRATVNAFDASPAMLAAAKSHPNVRYAAGLAHKLPLAAQSVDLLCANFILSWVTDIDACLKEWRRVLKPNGLIMLSMLGVDTLEEVCQEHQVALMPHLFDMHDVGDALVKVGFDDPVMDMSYAQVKYKDVARLEKELMASGFIDKPFDFTAKEIQVCFEIIHGHAFAPAPSSEYAADDAGVVRVPLSQLRKQLQK